METRNVEVTLEKAQEWYKNGGFLKEIALQAFTEEELKESLFRSIKTFEDACYAVMLNPYTEGRLIKQIEEVSKASAAAYKLNIIKKALNKGHKMDFKKGEFWYPKTPAVLSPNMCNKDIDGIEVAKVEIGCNTFILLGGAANCSSLNGLGCFSAINGMAHAYAYSGFLGCATEEIAQHMGRYFAKEIFEAKYGDTIDFKWV